jgi:Protein of unknown function (DUF2510)
VELTSDEYVQRGPTADPLDLADFTWSRAVDWTLGGVLALLAVVVSVLVLGIGFWTFLTGILLLYVVSWWRCTRMARGVPLLEASAHQGWLRAMVQIGSGSMLQTIGSGRTATLTVADGWVVLDSTAHEAWPAAQVRVGGSPSFWLSRGVELITPSGSRYVRLVRPGDPGAYLRVVLDRRAAPAIARAIEVQRSVQIADVANTQGGGPPPGWFPDPGGTPQWRWWDGSTWTAEVRPGS